jgi:PAS domain S-box-containing protein
LAGLGGLSKGLQKGAQRLRVAGLWQRFWRPESVLWLLLGSLLLLPVVMVSSMSAATVAQMELQADEISTLASGIRSYYADNVIARLQAADGQAVYSENYRDIHGGIPIPATLSIELGALFDNAHSDGRIAYEFLSDYPFAKRLVQPLDSFERSAIQAFRENPQRKTYTQLKGNGLGRSTYRLATPVIMRPACVTCHNAHPDSPKRDWKVGDVRGIQEVSVRGLQAEGFGNLSGLFAYVGIVGLTSLAATSVFQRQSRKLSQVNRQLLDSNQRESSLAVRLSDQLQELSIFGSVVDDSVVGISIADMRKPDAPLIYVNNAFTAITGYSRDLAVGYNCRFLQGPDTDPAELECLRQALRDGKAYSGELVNYKQDGTRFWNRLTLYPIRLGESDQPDYYVANQVDVTALKEAAVLSLASLEPLQKDVGEARQALDDAERFAQALNEQINRSGMVSTEAKAYLIADEQAHGRIANFLATIETLLARVVRPE